jgi:hypothetical protein
MPALHRFRESDFSDLGEAAAIATAGCVNSRRTSASTGLSFARHLSGRMSTDVGS